jgi:hypothetical protein
MDLIESTVKCLRSLRAEVFEDRKNERYTLDFCFVLAASLIMCIVQTSFLIVFPYISTFNTSFRIGFSHIAVLVG